MAEFSSSKISPKNNINWLDIGGGIDILKNLIAGWSPPKAE